jgi:predicted GNAT superfamily acetyltransferase
VPAAVLILTVKLGGILAGAFEPGVPDGDGMIGFVYSLPGWRAGRVLQWSHMLAVQEAHRQSGIGRELKLAQRNRTLAMGLDLIEWTYDPLQAVNAMLNVRRLGATASVYLENIYGTSSSALHRGTPTDRFVAEWWIRTPRVVQAIEGMSPQTEVRPSRVVNEVTDAGGMLACTTLDLTASEDEVSIAIPRQFNAIQRDAPALALDWRLKTRELFQSYFSRGYVVDDFSLAGDRGIYRLSRTASRDQKEVEQ